jgi:drug/metabolite transporter (DMT)-like permease
VIGYALALGAATLFGLGGIIAKLAFAAGLYPSELAEFRVLFGFLAFLAFVALARPAALRVRRADLPILVAFGTVGLGGVQWSYYEAIQRLPIGVALVVQYTAPLLLLLYARLRGKKVGPRLWVAAVLTLVGCYFVVGAYDASLFALNAAGLGFAVMSALIFALYFALAERILRRYTVWTLLVYGFGFALVAWMALRPLWLLPWDTAIELAPLIVGVVLVATVFPFALIFAAVRFIDAARTSLTSSFEPVVAALAAFLVLREGLEPLQLLGGGVVLAGIALVQSLRPTMESV